MPFVRFFSATFFCTRKNASHFSLSGAKKRHIQPERYTPYCPENFLKNNSLKNSVNNMVKNI
jgi:hypothetical protein